MPEPTDPIRDPELTAEDRKWLAERLGSDHSVVTGLAERLHGRLKFDESFDDEEAEDRHAFRLAREQAQKQISAFVAALEDSPTQPRYTVQEFTERLQSVAARRAAGRAAFLDRYPEADWDRQFEAVQMSWDGNAAAGIEAAIDAAFNSSTSTGEGDGDDR